MVDLIIYNLLFNLHLKALFLISYSLFLISYFPSLPAFADAFVFEADSGQGFCIGDVFFIEQDGWVYFLFFAR
jgi:hypothetical protein